MSSPCLFFFLVRADSIWCIVDRKCASFILIPQYHHITSSSESTLPMLETFVTQTLRRHDWVLPCCTTCCCSIAFQMLIKELEASVPVIRVHMVAFVVWLSHELMYHCSTFTKLLCISSIVRRVVYFT